MLLKKVILAGNHTFSRFLWFLITFLVQKKSHFSTGPMYSLYSIFHIQLRFLNLMRQRHIQSITFHTNKPPLDWCTRRRCARGYIVLSLGRPCCSTIFANILASAVRLDSGDSWIRCNLWWWVINKKKFVSKLLCCQKPHAKCVFSPFFLNLYIFYCAIPLWKINKIASGSVILYIQLLYTKMKYRNANIWVVSLRQGLLSLFSVIFF